MTTSKCVREYAPIAAIRERERCMSTCDLSCKHRRQRHDLVGVAPLLDGGNHRAPGVLVAVCQPELGLRVDVAAIGARPREELQLTGMLDTQALNITVIGILQPTPH